jgi:fibronectin type 3 domain-containing protein
VVAVYPAATPITDLRAMLTEQAIVLAWSPPGRTSTGASLTSPAYRVYRAEAAPATVPGGGLPAHQHPNFQLLGAATDGAYRDMTFEFDHTYIYTVRETSPAGAETIESADSNLVTVEAKDRFPPAVPQDVVAVFVPATPEMPANVDLTWAINSEPDFAGYIVFRSGQPNDTGERLTPVPLPVPAFRDASIAAGQTYYYRIAAVDRAGNESMPSESVVVPIP